MSEKTRNTPGIPPQENPELSEQKRLKEHAIATLTQLGIPAEAGQSLIEAYREIEEKEGPERAAELVCDGIIRVLTEDEERKRKATKNSTPKDVEQWAAEQEMQEEWRRLTELLDKVPVISPIDAKNGIAPLIDKVIMQRVSYLIRRKKKNLAVLCPHTEVEQPPRDRVVSTQEMAKQRSLFDEVAQGGQFWVERRNTIVAVLIPPIPKKYKLLQKTLAPKRSHRK